MAVTGRKLEAAYRNCFNTPAGRIVLVDLFHRCHVMNPTIVIGNEQHSAFQEGERRVFIRIWGMMYPKKEKKEEKTIERYGEMRNE